MPKPKQVIDKKELRHFLQKQRPEYMVLSALVQLETIPLTANDKRDHHALSGVGHRFDNLKLSPVCKTLRTGLQTPSSKQIEVVSRGKELTKWTGINILS